MGSALVVVFSLPQALGEPLGGWIWVAFFGTSACLAGRAVLAELSSDGIARALDATTYGLMVVFYSFTTAVGLLDDVVLAMASPFFSRPLSS